MNKVTNEKGAALVIVLTIITLMSIFILILLYQLNTLSVQFNKTEANIQADNLAEMGVEYFNSYVENVIEEAGQNADIMEYLQENLESIPPVNIDTGMFFRIELDKSEGINPVDDTIEIQYESIGDVNGTSKTLRRNIFITEENSENNSTYNDNNDSNENNENNDNTMIRKIMAMTTVTATKMKKMKKMKTTHGDRHGMWTQSGLFGNTWLS